MKQNKKRTATPNQKSKTKTRNELLLIAGLLVIMIGFYLGNKLLYSKTTGTVEVSVNGSLTGSYDLSLPEDIIIEGTNGGTNHLIIHDGTASITEATCPDKVCVRQGTIHESGQSLVCLPNKVIITIK